MTEERDQANVVEATVFVFDISSSTHILEDLHRTGNLRQWRNLLISLKKFLVAEGKKFTFELNNFTGDGWIICFDFDVDGSDLFSFIQRLCKKYEEIYQDKVLPVLESPPTLIGLSMGVDRGPLIKIRINQRGEFVGRPLNMACRLQNAVKDQGHNPNKLLMTKPFYNSIKRDVSAWKFEEVRTPLRNIAGGASIHCIKLVELNSAACE